MGKEPFTSFIGDFGNWSWVVLFVERPFEDVLSAYANCVGEKPSGVIPIAPGDHASDPSGTVVECVDTDWTIVFHRVGIWDDFDAAALAGGLGARVIAFEAEDTSGSSTCSSIEPDGTVVRMQTDDAAENDAELYECMEEFEEIPSRPATHTIDSYDAYLTSQGIALINISLNSDNTSAIVDAGDVDRVGRVVLVGNPNGE